SDAETYIYSLAPSHRRYFFKYYWDAKTEPTRLKRIEQIYDALQKKWDYGLMLRRGKPREE
ncbi:MAG: YdeI/OmpD-associated family protein, partial [Mucilaginibacter polytrichastri]|nr:YdeI/OmpD-associated family protein [Mucilaginibacter polytrichastri]